MTWQVMVNRLAARVMLGLALLLGGWELVAARTFKPGKCTNTHAGCVERCAARYQDHAQTLACFKRTCDFQYDNCVRNQSKKTSEGADASVPVRPRPGARVPPTGGVTTDPSPAPRGPTGARAP